MRFIPTGGINKSNMMDYLSLSSVIAVGGSWMVERVSSIVAIQGDYQADKRGCQPCQRLRGETMAVLELKKPEECRYDLVSLGEVMLRLDPGEGRIHTARSFKVWEGGGEYNVARGLRSVSA
jgi:hypothetical protein